MDDLRDVGPAAPAPSHNIPEYTVGEISGAVKRTLEGAFGRIRVRGEITELKRYPSGHIYLSLKDETSKLAAVIWKSAVPRVIGVITSERGAVIQDIRTTIARRFPRAILLWPVPVQGEGAAEKIVQAIRGFDALPPGGAIPRPDVLIVARGGGSLEDLLAFNDEAVVRAAAACTIPLISAVGHETDTTLIDHAADRRAPTPTAAAEMAVPVRAELAATVQQAAARLAGAVVRAMQEGRLRLGRAERGLPDLPAVVGAARQRLDDRGQRLDLALPNLVAARLSALVAVDRRMPTPDRLFLPRRAQVALEGERLRSALRHAVARRQAAAAAIVPRLRAATLLAALRESSARLHGAAARLESLSPLAVLARGYALVFDPAGHAVTSAAGVRPGDPLSLRFADGEVAVNVAGGRPGSRQRSLPL